MTVFREGNLYLFTVLLACAFFVSCSDSGEENGEDGSEYLYTETIRLFEVYADSLDHAANPEEARQLFSRLNASLEKLSLSLPPETDTLLSIGQNDTIIMHFDRLYETYRRKTALLDTISALEDE